jgi:N6-adenosine-specific RNA methylase IME4
MSGDYSTLVVDPPWHYDRAGGYSWRKGRPSGESRQMLAYETMSVEEIAALPLGDVAAPDAHLYLWTTQRYLYEAPRIAKAWGFDPIKTLIWCKAPTGFSMGGAYGNACEFVLFARRGSLAAMSRVPRDWFEWPRRDHSAKPEAFLDMVEAVSPGPYLEVFARRARLGWDYAGDGSLGTVPVAGLRAPEEE